MHASHDGEMDTENAADKVEELWSYKEKITSFSKTFYELLDFGGND